MLRPCFLQHWGTQESRLVYEGEVKAEVSFGGAQEDEAALPEVPFDPNKKTENEQWAVIDEKYGKSRYQDSIIDYVDKLLPGEQAEYRMALAMDSTKRYTEFYDRIKDIFMTTSVDLKAKFDYSVNRIKDGTRSELSILKSAVEKAKPMTEFKEAMPSPENKDAVEDYFEKYLYALNGRYFNVDVNEGIKIPGSGIPIIDPLLHPDTKVLDNRAYPKEKQNVPIFGIFTGSDVFRGAKYKSKSSDFQKKMASWVEVKLTWMLNKKETTTSDLEAFRNEITARYNMYSRIDSNSSIISGRDLAALEVAANPPPDVVARMLDESDDKAIRRLEAMHLMDRGKWEDTVEMAGRVIIRAAENSGMESEFVAEMKKYRTVEGDDLKSQFSDAKGEFEDMLEELAKVGVPETLEFIRKFNVGVHGEILDFEKAVEPPSLTMQVGKQMDYLLGGVLVPQRDTDQMLVRFMAGNLDTRNDILKNNGTREVLFRAIKQATEQYPELYRRDFGSIPDDASKLRRSARIEKPTFHDQAAQMQALIIFGNQAKAIVGKLQRTLDHAGKDYIGEIDRTSVPEDPNVIRTGLRFKAPGPATVPYTSALVRGGFNGRDLALKGAKMLGILAVVSNMAQSYSETHGDFVDRVLDTVEKAATNQGVLAGAAVTVGAHMAERNKAFLRYPWLSQHERLGAMVAFKLDNMSARVGREEANRFLFNNAEWRALADPALDPAQIKELIQESAKRTASGSHPVITVEDMRKVIKDESIITTLTTGGKSARMRYLFYEKFFSAAVKPDVNQMKELCTGTSHISPSPVGV